MNRSIFYFLIPALLTGAGLAARAQTGAESKPVTLNISQVPVQTALKMLFASAGIRNFVIDPDVPGEARVGTLSLSGVSFSVALKQVLGSVNPPLVAELQDGVYHVQAGASVLPSSETRAVFSAEDTGQSSFYKLGIKHYDAGVIADALTRRSGIILLPPNFVIPANPGVPGTLGPPNAATLGAARGLGPVAANGGAFQPGQPSANVLPPGVKRIFVLESDNSLVVEATAQGYDNLTGERLLSGGYTQVY